MCVGSRPRHGLTGDRHAGLLQERAIQGGVFDDNASSPAVRVRRGRDAAADDHGVDVRQCPAQPPDHIREIVAGHAERDRGRSGARDERPKARPVRVRDAAGPSGAPARGPRRRSPGRPRADAGGRRRCPRRPLRPARRRRARAACRRSARSCRLAGRRPAGARNRPRAPTTCTAQAAGRGPVASRPLGPAAAPEASSGVVCSTGTTASAPAGRGAPVAMRTAVPASTRSREISPARTSPTTRRTTGRSSVAAAVSAARIA